MTGLLDLYANDELQVMKEQRLCDLQDHRKSPNRVSKKTYVTRRDDIVSEITMIDDELTFRKTMSLAQNLAAFGFEE